jgi:hypothetical protein
MQIVPIIKDNTQRLKKKTTNKQQQQTKQKAFLHTV